jgi:hypothetical protein
MVTYQQSKSLELPEQASKGKVGTAMLLQPSAAASDQVVSWIGEFILGSIALLAVAIAYWAIRQFKDAKNQHIEALNTAADKKDEANEKHVVAYQQTAQMTVAAIEKLTAIEATQTAAIQENTRALTDLRGAIDAQKSTIDSVVRQAVMRRSSDRWPAQRPPPSPGEGGE